MNGLNMVILSGWVMWGGRRNKVIFFWWIMFVKVKCICDLWLFKSIKVGFWFGLLVILVWCVKWLVKVFKYCIIWLIIFIYFIWGFWWCFFKKNRYLMFIWMKYGGIWLLIVFFVVIIVIVDDFGDVIVCVFVFLL